ncbi:MAG: hypothetical protein ACXWQO_17820 [Bdellovibrionota bacterium]
MRQYLYCVLALALTACARPNIELETSELDRSMGSQPVGLLEVSRANTGKTLGITFTETLGESAYCTGTVLGSGEVVTSTDCLLNSDQSFTAEQMSFHLRLPGNGQTKKYAVKSIRTDTKRNLAYLSLKDMPEFPVMRALAIRAKWDEPADKPSPPTLNAIAVSVSAPDKKGVAHVRVSSVSLGNTLPREVPAPVVTPNPPDSGIPGDTNGDGIVDGNDAITQPAVATIPPPGRPHAADGTTPTPAPVKAESAWAHPRPVNISGLKDGSLGSPIFYQNEIVGIVKGGDANLGNAQWAVGN